MHHNLVTLSSAAQSSAHPALGILTGGQRFGQRGGHASVAAELQGLYSGGPQRISLAAQTMGNLPQTNFEQRERNMGGQQNLRRVAHSHRSANTPVGGRYNDVSQTSRNFTQESMQSVTEPEYKTIKTIVVLDHSANCIPSASSNVFKTLYAQGRVLRDVKLSVDKRPVEAVQEMMPNFQFLGRVPYKIVVNNSSRGSTTSLMMTVFGNAHGLKEPSTVDLASLPGCCIGIRLTGQLPQEQAREFVEMHEGMLNSEDEQQQVGDDRYSRMRPLSAAAAASMDQEGDTMVSRRRRISGEFRGDADSHYDADAALAARMQQEEDEAGDNGGVEVSESSSSSAFIPMIDLSTGGLRLPSFVPRPSAAVIAAAMAAIADDESDSGAARIQTSAARGHSLTLTIPAFRQHLRIESPAYAMLDPIVIGPLREAQGDADHRDVPLRPAEVVSATLSALRNLDVVERKHHLRLLQEVQFDFGPDTIDQGGPWRALSELSGEGFIAMTISNGCNRFFRLFEELDANTTKALPFLNASWETLTPACQTEALEVMYLFGVHLFLVAVAGGTWPQQLDPALVASMIPGHELVTEDCQHRSLYIQQLLAAGSNDALLQYCDSLQLNVAEFASTMRPTVPQCEAGVAAVDTDAQSATYVLQLEAFDLERAAACRGRIIWHSIVGSRSVAINAIQQGFNQFGILSRISPGNIQRFLTGAYKILESAADFWKSWNPKRKPLACVMGSLMHKLAVMFEKYVDEVATHDDLLRLKVALTGNKQIPQPANLLMGFELNNASDWVTKLPKVSTCLCFIMLSPGRYINEQLNQQVGVMIYFACVCDAYNSH
jgi:hypothetical protein